VGRIPPLSGGEHYRFKVLVQGSRFRVHEVLFSVLLNLNPEQNPVNSEL